MHRLRWQKIRFVVIFISRITVSSGSSNPEPSECLMRGADKHSPFSASKMYDDGSWVLSRPRTESTTASMTASRCWLDWRPKSCHEPTFDPARVCESIGPRGILMVGDSTTKATGNDLIRRLGGHLQSLDTMAFRNVFDKSSNLTVKDASVKVQNVSNIQSRYIARICNESKVAAFVRDDLLDVKTSPYPLTRGHTIPCKRGNCTVGPKCIGRGSMTAKHVCDFWAQPSFLDWFSTVVVSTGSHQLNVHLHRDASQRALNALEAQQTRRAGTQVVFQSTTSGCRSCKRDGERRPFPNISTAITAIAKQPNI